MKADRAPGYISAECEAAVILKVMLDDGVDWVYGLAPYSQSKLLSPCLVAIQVSAANDKRSWPVFPAALPSFEPETISNIITAPDRIVVSVAEYHKAGRRFGIELDRKRAVGLAVTRTRRAHCVTADYFAAQDASYCTGIQDHGIAGASGARSVTLAWAIGGPGVVGK